MMIIKRIYHIPKGRSCQSRNDIDKSKRQDVLNYNSTCRENLKENFSEKPKENNNNKKKIKLLCSLWYNNMRFGND